MLDFAPAYDAILRQFVDWACERAYAHAARFLEEWAHPRVTAELPQYIYPVVSGSQTFPGCGRNETNDYQVHHMRELWKCPSINFSSSGAAHR